MFDGVVVCSFVYADPFVRAQEFCDGYGFSSWSLRVDVWISGAECGDIAIESSEGVLDVALRGTTDREHIQSRDSEFSRIFDISTIPYTCQCVECLGSIETREKSMSPVTLCEVMVRVRGLIVKL